MKGQWYPNRPRSARYKWAISSSDGGSQGQSRKWESGCSIGQPGQTGAACGTDRNMWSNIHWNLMHWANSQSKSETGLFLRTPTLQQWSQSRHISKHPTAQETSRKGKWKECNSQVMSRNAAPNCLHDMMWLLHLGVHNSCGFYIKTCTKSSQSMSKQKSSGCYTTTSSWGIISSYWQLMVSVVWPLLTAHVLSNGRLTIMCMPAILTNNCCCFS